MMTEYLHKVQYYETDQMGVVHHSNYVRWMEEARIDCLDRLGICYAELERRDIISPVLEVSCKYHAMSRFGETVQIQVRVAEVGRVRYRLCYTVADQKTGQLRAEGETVHCFVDRKDRVISLKHADPALYERFCAAEEP